MFRTIVATSLVALLCACASTATLTTAFDPNSAAFINTQGKNTITGQAFMRRNDGVVVYGAGSTVTLIPKTAYSDERMTKIYGTGRYSYTGTTFKNNDATYETYTRSTTADGEGKFAFPNVADGQYYLSTAVTWMVEIQQGGAIMAPVTVSGGQTVNVIMDGQVH